ATRWGPNGPAARRSGRAAARRPLPRARTPSSGTSRWCRSGRSRPLLFSPDPVPTGGTVQGKDRESPGPLTSPDTEGAGARTSPCLSCPPILRVLSATAGPPAPIFSVDDDGAPRYRGIGLREVRAMPFGRLWGLLAGTERDLPPAEPYHLPVRTGDTRADVLSALAQLAPVWSYRPLSEIS